MTHSLSFCLAENKYISSSFLKIFLLKQNSNLTGFSFKRCSSVFWLTLFLMRNQWLFSYHCSPRHYFFFRCFLDFFFLSLAFQQIGNKCLSVTDIFNQIWKASYYICKYFSLLFLGLEYTYVRVIDTEFHRLKL